VNWRNLLIFGIALLLSGALLTADYYLAQIQRHLVFVAGWVFVIGLFAMVIGLRHNDRELDGAELTRFQRRFATSGAIFLFLIANQLVYSSYELPNGVFGGFLFLLFLLVMGTGLNLRRAEYRLHLAVQYWDENSGVVRVETRDGYSRARSFHFGFVVATLPVALLNGILVHAHGALSNLVDKGVS
jgi:hypothetical protein